MEFQNKTVVVTGAAGIFGGWIAEHFAAEGARLLLTDAREDGLAAISARLSLSPDSIAVRTADLTEAGQIEDLAAWVKAECGAPDILVNNAGIYTKFALLEMEAEDWDRVFGVNLRAPFLLSRSIARLMIAEARAGSIVNISSGAARQMRNGSVPYCTSKTALERLTKGFALELAPYGIRVNAVEPGFAPGSEVSHLSQDYVEAMTRRIPLGRTSGPKDAPAAVAFLASEKASFITGAVLSVDGGNSIGTFESGTLGAAPGTAASGGS